MKSLKITAGGEKGLPSGPTLKKPVHFLMGTSSRLNRVSWDIIIFWIRRLESVRQPWQKSMGSPHSVTGTTGLATAGCYWKNRFRDRKSTRLNSSHVAISYAVFCLK